MATIKMQFQDSEGRTYGHTVISDLPRLETVISEKGWQYKVNELYKPVGMTLISVRLVNTMETEMEAG